MAVSGTIAQGSIKIVLAGYELAKTQLAGIQGQIAKTNDSLKSIGSASTKGFAAATAGILGFLKAADPYRWTVFTQKLEVLSIHIGRIFIPLLIAATKQLDRLINYFRNMTDAQREQILHWAKIGLAVLAAGTALGLLMSGLPQLIGLIKTLTTVVTLFTSASGLKLVLLLAALAVGVLQATGMFDKIVPMMGQMGKTFEILREPVSKLMLALQEAGKKILPALVAVVLIVAKVVESLAPIFGEVLEIVADLVTVLAELFAGFMETFGPTIKDFIGGVLYVIREIFDVIQRLVQACRDAAEIMDRLNPFSDDEEGGEADTGDGDYSGGSATDTGGDYGYGGRSGAGVLADGTGSAGRGGGGSTFAPGVQYRKMESFGLEEGFKKAQAGAMFDPAKIAERERLNIAKGSYAALKSIDGKVGGKPDAYDSF